MVKRRKPNSASKAVRDATLVNRLGLKLPPKFIKSFSKAYKGKKRENEINQINSMISETKTINDLLPLIPKVDPNQVSRATRINRKALNAPISKLPRGVKKDLLNYFEEKGVPKNYLDSLKKKLS